MVLSHIHISDFIHRDVYQSPYAYCCIKMEAQVL